MQERVRSSFIPRKEDVTEDYWEWLRWRCSQVCSKWQPMVDFMNLTVWHVFM
jgi:hypothetical protein